MQLQDELDTVLQRASGSSVLATSEERLRFTLNVKRDLANIFYQWNTVMYPLLQGLPVDTGTESLDVGLGGNTLYTDTESTEDSPSMYYTTDLGRRRTIRESFDVVLSEIARLESLQAQATPSFNQILLYGQDFSTVAWQDLTTDSLARDTVNYANVLLVPPDSAVNVIANWVVMDNSTSVTRAVAGTTVALAHRLGSAGAEVVNKSMEIGDDDDQDEQTIVISGSTLTARARFLTVSSTGALVFQIECTNGTSTTKATAQISWTQVNNQAY